MSKTAKVWITIIVIVIILLIVWFVWGKKSSSTNPLPSETPVSSAPQASATTQPLKSALNSSASDSSDAAISADLKQVDTEMSAMNTDSASIDSSVDNADSPSSTI